MSINQSDCVEERSDECQSLDLFITRGISTNFSRKHVRTPAPLVPTYQMPNTHYISHNISHVRDY